MYQINKKLLVVFVLTITILAAIFVVTTQNEIKSIKKTVEEVKDQPLSVRILADTSYGTSPLTVNFKPLISNNKAEVKYHWEFGNGNTSNEQNPSNTYRENGIFSCKLTIEDTNIKISDSFNVTVFPNNPPKVKIKCSTTGFRPIKINFDAEVFDPEGEKLEFSWLLKHPPRFGNERKESFSTKNFSKTFILPGRYVAELTVTDESGNQVTDYEIVQVQKSQVELMIQSMKFIFMLTLPSTLSFIWGLIGYPEKLITLLDNNWFKLGPGMQSALSFLLNTILAINYEPPIHKAELAFSEIDDINLSAYVNEATREVEEEASVSSSFTITNIDSENISKNVYIALYNPFSKEEGLVDEIEKEDLIVSIDEAGGAISNKLFYNGKYTNWVNCFNIEKLAPGDSRTLDLTVLLKKGGTFTKGSYECTLYIYQEKSLDKAEYVDEVDFTVEL